MKVYRCFTLLLLVFVLTNCSEQEQLKPIALQRVYSGEELFKGIMFLENDMLDHLPETKKMFPNFNQLINAQQDKKVFAEMKSIIIEKIKQENPGFFNKFQENIQSGNHFLVTQALNDGAKALVNALKSEYAYETLSIEDEEALRQINLNDFIDSKGNIKEDKLTEFIEKNHVLNAHGLHTNGSARGQCFAIALNAIIVINAAVLLNVVVGTNAVLALNIAFGVNEAAAYTKAFSVPSPSSGGTSASSGGGISDNRPNPQLSPAGSQPLAREIVVNEIATKLSL